MQDPVTAPRALKIEFEDMTTFTQWAEENPNSKLLAIVILLGKLLGSPRSINPLSHEESLVRNLPMLFNCQMPLYRVLGEGQPQSEQRVAALGNAARVIVVREASFTDPANIGFISLKMMVLDPGNAELLTLGIGVNIAAEWVAVGWVTEFSAG